MLGKFTGKLACMRMQPLLWDYTKSRLSRADRERVDRHLQTCAACRNRAVDEARLAGYVAIYGEQPVVAPPPAWQELHNAIAAAPGHKIGLAPVPRLRPVWLLCGGLAAAGLLALFASQLRPELHRIPSPLPRSATPNTQYPTPNTQPSGPFTPSERLVQTHTGSAIRRIPLPPLSPASTTPHGAKSADPAVQTEDDLHYLNAGAVAVLTGWTAMRPDQIGQLQADIDRTVHGGDDFVRVSLPPLAAQGPQGAQAALEAYQREKEIVDARLTHKVTLACKAASFRDVCSSLRKTTGIDLRANQTVADEKATLFCDDCPLRDIMRQITHVFGFVWVRKGQEGDYAYELLQDVRSRIAEEELRNRDRNAAVIALADAMERYRPYLDMTPAKLREAARKARGEQAELLWQMAGPAWGGIECYFNLTGAQRDALFNDQEIKFSGNPSLPGAVLDPQMNKALLEASGIQIMTTGSGSPAMTFVLYGKDSPETLPSIGTPAADWPGACATMGLQINHPEPGKLVLSGNVGINLSASSSGPGGGISSPFTLAEYNGPTTSGPENAKWNRALRNLPEFRRIISLAPQHSCPRPNAGGRGPGMAGPPLTDMFGIESKSEPHLTSADFWEAVHQQTRMQIVADAYTHLYAPAGMTQNQVSVFDALCHDADLLGVRWKKEGVFLQGRDVTFYWDKLKDVPERLLTHWQQDAAQPEGLPLLDLLEIAQLSDDQLNAVATDRGVRECWNLPEYALMGPHSNIRTEARLTAQLTAAQLDQAQQAAGIPLSDLTPSRQEEWAAYLIQQRHIPTQMLPGLRLHLDYTPQGRYVWTPTFPDTIDRMQARELPVIADKTEGGALAAAQRVYAEAKPEQIRHTIGVLAITLYRETPTGKQIVAEVGKPPVLLIPTNPPH
jgi:hypothetical protein